MYKVYCDDHLIFDTKMECLKIFDAKLELELNKTGSFTFSLYPSHPYFDQLHRLKSIIKVYQDGYLLFRGRILNDKQGFYNEKQVSCEGELAFLLDSVQRPYDFMSGDKHTTISEFFTFLITNHNSQVDSDHQFIVGNITVTDPNDYIVRADTQYLTTWETINQKLIETNGGYLFVRHESDGNYIDYLEDFDAVSSQKVEFGKNLLALNKITKGEDIATAIIPLGARLTDEEGNEIPERLTIKSVNDDVDYVFNQKAVDQYGWIFKTVIWDDVTIASNLKTKGEAYLADAINMVVTIDLDAVDLSMLDTDISAFHLGVYIPVVTSPHGLNSNFLVKKLSINLLNPKSNKLTLGTTYSTFTEQTSSGMKDYAILSNEIDATVSKTNNIIQQVDIKLWEVENLDITAERMETGVKITVTNKDGVKNVVFIRDGADGAQGISVVTSSIDNSGHLILTLSDNSTIDAGELPQPDYTEIVDLTAHTIDEIIEIGTLESGTATSSLSTLPTISRAPYINLNSTTKLDSGVSIDVTPIYSMTPYVAGKINISSVNKFYKLGFPVGESKQLSGVMLKVNGGTYSGAITATIRYIPD